MLSNKERLEVLDRTLEYMLVHKAPRAIDLVVRNILDDTGYFQKYDLEDWFYVPIKAMIELYPEIEEFKPRKIYGNNYWWEPKDKKIRIEVLKNLIAKIQKKCGY